MMGGDHDSSITSMSCIHPWQTCFRHTKNSAFSRGRWCVRVCWSAGCSERKREAALQMVPHEATKSSSKYQGKGDTASSEIPSRCGRIACLLRSAVLRSAVLRSGVLSLHVHAVVYFIIVCADPRYQRYGSGYGVGSWLRKLTYLRPETRDQSVSMHRARGWHV